MTTSGAPGSGASIQLRSPASINKSTTPLIVLDGVIMSQTNPNTADLQAYDLESAEVVKGAAAASLYGSRAANGVISLRSRRGTSLADGRTEFSLRTEFGRSDLPRRIPFATYHAFRVNDNGEYVDENGQVVSRDDRVERPDSVRFQDQRYSGATFDQVDRFFGGNAFGNTSLSVARNSGATSFRAMLSTNNADGVVPMDGGYRRTDVRLNLDQRFASALTMGLSVSHGRSKRSLTDEGENSPFFDLINQAPDVDLLQTDPDGTRYIFQPDSTSQGARPNPLYMLAVRDWKSERARTLANAELRWNPREWFTWDGNLSYDRGDELTQFHFPRGAKSAIQSLQTGAVRRSDEGVTATNASTTATIKQRAGDLTMRFAVRGLMEREQVDRFDANAQNLSVVGVPNLESGLSFTGTSLATSIRTNAAFVSSAFDYDGRYIADLLLRRDGSSLFGEDERWQTYHRASLAWRLSAEDWWPVPALNEFKLRASTGTAGGRPSFADQFETYALNAGGVLTKSTLGNPDLRPELAREQEFGVDFVVKNRVSVQVTRANTVVRDQLIEVPLPASSGFMFQWQNAGTVTGNSAELTIEAQVLRGGGVTWNSGLVADRVRNRITSFDRSCFRVGTTGHRCAGTTIGSMWGATFLRDVSQLPSAHANSHAQFARNDDGLLVPVGPDGSFAERKWGQTVTIDGQSYAWGMPITLKAASGSDSIVQIGDGTPDYRIGWSNSISWRGLTLYGLIDMQKGGDVYNRTRQRMYQYYRSADVDQTGKAELDKKPTQYYSTLYNANSVVDWFVEDGGFVKLRELSVRYQLPVSFMRAFGRTNARSASIALIGRNLFTKTRYSGYDPEVGTPLNRVDEFGYPAFRTITGSFQVDF